LRVGGVLEDNKMKYIQMILEYWFVLREKLKSRSTLHYIILIEEERKIECDKLKAYLKKYKPAILKVEGLSA
jgi:hypothetical protein